MWAVLACLSALKPQLPAAPLGTAFTYQGRITEAGTPANGRYDFRFAIYDMESGGSPVAGPLTNAAVAVSNGLFTSTLEFGTGVFTGDARWLEMGVRSNGVPTGFTLLSPRTEINPTPYASYSPKATAGGNAANDIAKWTGRAWSALGSRMNAIVNALAVSGTDLYAGGAFTTAGGIPANGIAQWNGTGWSALGSGMNSSVAALVASGADIYAGGYFTTAGGKVSGYAARAIISPGFWLSIKTGLPGSHTTTLVYEGLPTNQYVVQFATNLPASSWFTLVTNTAGANGYGTVIDPSATNNRRFYRLTW